MLGVKFGRRSWCPLVPAIVALFWAVVAAPAVAQSTCLTATPISIGGVFNGNNAASPGDGVTGLCVTTGRAAWHSFVPSITGIHTISTCGSGINAVAALFTDCGLAAVACDDDTCGDDALLVTSLTAGQTYYLRVASNGSTAGGAYAVLISQPPTGPISGDLCGSGTFVPINSTQNFTNGPTTGSDVSACGSGDTSDVYYAFSADTPGTYRVQVCTQAFQPVLSVQAACFSATSVQCDVGTQTAPCAGGGSAALSITPASVPTQVLIRVAGVRGSFGAFALTLFAPSANDACASARVLAAGVPQLGRTSPIIATDTSVNCAASSLDVWYSFTPQIAGSYTISTCSSATFDTVLSVHTACPGAPGAGVIACSDNSCGSASSVTLSLAPGVSYRVRVAGKGAAPNGQWGEFTILAAQNAPSNDQCGAGTIINEGTLITGTTAGATGADLTPECAEGDTKDVWYAFSPPLNATYFVHTCGSPSAASVSIFDSCAGSLIACSDGDPSFCGSTSGGRITAALIGGTTYRIRIATLGGGEGQFQFAVIRQTSTGDDCATPIPLTLGVPAAASFAGATVSGIGGCTPASLSPDLWFSFTPSITRHYRIQSCGSATPLAFTVYAGASCDPGASPLACGTSAATFCGSEGSIVRAILSAGQTYLIRAAATSSLLGAATITVENDAPTNDRCDDAQLLPLNTVVAGANVDSATDALGSCAADGRDVWYQIVPVATGWYRIDTCPSAGGGPLNTVITLHASCAAPAFACNDDNTTTCGSGSNRSGLVQRLVAGNPVLVRVAGAAGAQGAFAVQWQLVAPPNDACAQAIAVGNGTFDLDTNGATDDPQQITGCTILPALTTLRSDVWFRYTAPQNGTVNVSLCGSQFDSVLAVSSATSGCPSSAYPILVCNDDVICVPGSGLTTPQSAVSFFATTGQAYFVRVGTRTGLGGPGFLQISQGNLCACDFNRSGSLTTLDIIDFLNAWFAQLSSADFNQSNGITTLDIIDFLNCFFTRPTGC